MRSKATIYRLCGMLKIAVEAFNEGLRYIPSNKLGEMLGESAHTIRKDITTLDNIVSSKYGYDLEILIDVIKGSLNLDYRKKCCVVGLGNIGSAILNYSGFLERGYDIVVGFDASNNKIETLDSEIDLYPAYEIEEIVKQKEIVLGIIAVPEKYAQEIADDLIKGGVKGIINFAPVVINVGNVDVQIRNIDLTTELNFLSALIV